MIQRSGATRLRVPSVIKKPSGSDATRTTKKRVRTVPRPCRIALVVVAISLIDIKARSYVSEMMRALL